MTKQSKIWAVAVAVSVIGAFLALNNEYHFTGGHGRVVDALIARNIAARGGAEAWQSVESLRLEGQMDLGQGLHVPYVMEQQRPDKMCLQFEFEEQIATQCVAAGSGWKLLPFRGRTEPEPMAENEYRELALGASIDGLLFNSAERGFNVKLMGKEMIDGRPAAKLEVTRPGEAIRWVYIDEETALEIKLESTRVLRGKERLVETLYSDWQETDGLLIPRRQETRTEGDQEWHFLTVDSVVSNPRLDDDRFKMPGSNGGAT